jgi:hypothetical protein
MLIIDHDTFKMTADVLMIINRRGRRPEGLYQWMKDTAERQHRNEPDFRGYLSTAGFELCFWQDEHGKVHARASVMAYTVMQWIAVGDAR